MNLNKISYISKKPSLYIDFLWSKKILVILILFLFLNSCSDSGCIEADDFGEYEIFKTNVLSNSLDGLCKYDNSLSCENPLHSPLLRGCAETDKCCDKSSDSEKKECLRKCEANCINNPKKAKNYAEKVGYSVKDQTNLSEPLWIAVGGEDFKIYDNTRILINAYGQIDIGEKESQSLSLSKDDLKDNISDKTKFLTVSTNDEVKMVISANFGIDTERANPKTYTSYFSNPTYNGTTEILKNNELKTYFHEIANGSKRIFAYFIPVPSVPDISDQNKVPVFADPKNSNCVLFKDGNGIYFKAECSADDNTNPDRYVSLNNENKSISLAFQMNNNFIDKNIKYNESGFLLQSNSQPLSSNAPIPPSDINKSYILQHTKQMIVGNMSARVIPPNQYEDYEVRLVLTPNTLGEEGIKKCKNYFDNPNSKTGYKILGINDPSPSNSNSFISMINETESNVINNFFQQSTPKFTYKSITLKSGNAIILEKKSSDNEIQDIACDFELHFYPYYKVSNKISGFVKMGHVNYLKMQNNGEFTDIESSKTTSISDCNMSYNIKNADGTYEFDDNKTYEFNKNPNSNTGIFIRNGQDLLIKPNIWDKFYELKNDSSVTFKINCGVAFFIEKKPKPAVICHKQKTKNINVNEDYVDTNDCSNLLIIDNAIQGCSFEYSKCDEYKKITPGTNSYTINSSFCPSECLPSEDDIKLTTCKSTFNGGSSYTSAGVCPDFSSITNFEGQTTAGTNPLAFQQSYNKINIKCTSSCPSNSSGICKNFSSFNSDLRYKSTYDSLSASDKANFMTFEKCKSCITNGIDKLKTSYISTNSANLDLCYDLENYTGSLFDFFNEESSVVDRMEVLKLKNKGLEYLKPFVNGYGNFYPLTFYDNTNDPFTSRNKFLTKNSAHFTSNGVLKFTLITNAIDVPLNNLKDKYSAEFINNIFYNNENNISYIKDGSILSVSPTSSSKFYNGQRLSIVPCYEDGSGACSGNSLTNDLIRTNPDSAGYAPEYLNIPRIISFYDDPNNPNYGQANVNNNYSFNDLGNLFRTTNALQEYENQCSGANQPYNGASFLCLNNHGSDVNANRLSIKIMDSEKPNCNITNASDCISGSDCKGTKKININWDGKSLGNCTREDENCIKKFYCTEPYFNNTGKYNLTIRVINPEKTKTTNLVDSIISPIMEEIDGYKLTIDENLDIMYGNFNSTIYPKYPPEGNTGNTTIKVNEDYSTDKSIFATLVGENIVEYYKTSIGYSALSKNFNVNIPPKTDGGCLNSTCVIAYIVAFVGDIDPSTGKIDIASGNCFSAHGPLRNKIRENCLRKKSCSFTLNSNADPITGNINPIFNEIPRTTISSYDAKEVTIIGTGICEKPLNIFVAYKISSKPMEKTNQAQRIYNQITNNPIFKSTLTLSMVLMITFYGLGFMMGVSEMKQSEIMNRLLKMGLIYLFTSPIYGWVFFEKFFVTFFKEGADFLTFLMASIFSDEEGKINQALNSGNFKDKSPLFESVDRVLGLYLMNDVVHKKITALLFYNFVGILYCVILYYCAITYVYAVSNAVLIYLTAQFFTTILFVLGPFFFIFILFKQTKTFFDNWLNSLIGFALQQIFVIFTLNIFNTIIYMVTKMALSYRICWDSIWNINSFGFNMSLFSYWTIQDAPPYITEISKITANGEAKNTSPSLTMIILTWSMVTIMRSFLSTISDLAASLSGGIQASSLGANISAGVNQAVGKTQQLGKKAFDKLGGNAFLRKVDKNVFASGAEAKQDRKRKKQENKNNRKDIANMLKAGNDAVSNYKKENATEYAKMSEDDKKKKLMEVKKNAMTEYAKGQGKSQKDIDKLMNLRGFKGNGGSNIFGAGINLIRSSGNLRTSLLNNVTNVDTGFSNKEITGAMKSMDEDQKKGFINNLKSGEIQSSSNNKPKNPLESIKKQFENPLINPREQAIKQLEDSGQITKKSNILNSDNIQVGLRFIGAESKRSVEDEKKIQAQMEKNAINSSVDKGSNFSARDINKFEKLAKYQDAKEIGDKQEMKDARKEFKEAKEEANVENKAILRQSPEQISQSLERIRKSKNENIAAKIENQKNQNSKEVEIQAATDNIKSKPEHAEMDDLNSKIKGGNATDEDKSKFNKMVIKDNEESQKNGEQSYVQKDSIRSFLQDELFELKEKGDSLKKVGEKLK